MEASQHVVVYHREGFGFQPAGFAVRLWFGEKGVDWKSKVMFDGPVPNIFLLSCWIVLPPGHPKQSGGEGWLALWFDQAIKPTVSNS